MDWDDKYDVPNAFQIVFVVLIWALCLGVRAIFSGGHVSLHDAEELGLVIVGIWAGGEWFEKNKADKRKMREAIDLIEQKLDEVLEDQKRSRRF